jgi:hypothetical protein
MRASHLASEGKEVAQDLGYKLNMPQCRTCCVAVIMLCCSLAEALEYVYYDT